MGTAREVRESGMDLLMARALQNRSSELNHLATQRPLAWRRMRSTERLERSTGPHAFKWRGQQNSAQLQRHTRMHTQHKTKSGRAGWVASNTNTAGGKTSTGA